MNKSLDKAYELLEALVKSTVKPSTAHVDRAIELAKVEAGVDANKQTQISNLLILARMKVDGSDDALNKAKQLMGVAGKTG